MSALSFAWPYIKKYYSFIYKMAINYVEYKHILGASWYTIEDATTYLFVSMIIYG